MGTTTSGDVFRLRNDEDAARAVDELEDWIRRRAAERFGFGETRLRQVWIAVWEAIQNALRHGSAPGEEVEVRLSPSGPPGLLEIQIAQPRDWDWQNHLGFSRKAAVDAGCFLFGGAIVMLWLADSVQAADRGRRIILSFSPHPKDDRPVVVPPYLAPGGGAAPMRQSGGCEG